MKISKRKTNIKLIYTCKYIHYETVEFIHYENVEYVSWEAFCVLIGVLTSSFSDGLFVISINMDENGSKVGKIHIPMNVENSDDRLLKKFIFICKV